MYTLVRFLASVNSHVSNQMIGLTETFSAMFTLIRFLPRMSQHMAGQSTVLTETFVTMTTLIRFFASMNSHVNHQVLAFIKHFPQCAHSMASIVYTNDYNGYTYTRVRLISH